MAVSVVDYVKSARQATAGGASPAKPARSFDQILAGKRTPDRPAEPGPKVEAKRPDAEKASSKKAEKADEPEKAREQDDTTPADESKPTDEAIDQTEEAAEHDAAKPVKKADAKDKPEKADESGEDVPDESAAKGKEGDALPLPAVTDSMSDDAGEKEAKPETVVKAKPADKVEVSPDAAIAAAQVQPQQQKTTDETPAEGEAESQPVAPVKLTAQPAAKAEPAVDADAAPAETGEGKVKLKPHAVAKADEETAVDPNLAMPADVTVAKPAAKAEASPTDDAAAALQAVSPHTKAEAAVAKLPALPADPSPAAAQKKVAEDNVDTIVTSVRGEIAKGGGTVQIRLDPPSLGQVQVSISMNDGVVSAQLQTSNDEATRLLSHNLQQLKTTLENAGVTVDKIQVRQAAPSDTQNNAQSGNDGDGRQQQGSNYQDGSARQEQQRREMLQRMWAKVAGNGDPLDLVA